MASTALSLPSILFWLAATCFTMTSNRLKKWNPRSSSSDVVLHFHLTSFSNSILHSEDAILRCLHKDGTILSRSYLYNHNRIAIIKPELINMNYFRCRYQCSNAPMPATSLFDHDQVYLSLHPSPILDLTMDMWRWDARNGCTSSPRTRDWRSKWDFMNYAFVTWSDSSIFFHHSYLSMICSGYSG